MRVLVLYYSQSGNTAAAAEAIAKRIGADLSSLEERRPRRGVLGALRSAFEALTGARTKLSPLDVDPQTYDLIVLGTPVWAARLSTAMRTFIEDHKSQLPHVAFFCTQGGGGGEKVMADMTKRTRRTPVATLILSDPETKAPQDAADLHRFTNDVSAFIDQTSRLRPVA